MLGAVLCAATFGLIISGMEAGVHGDSPVVSAAIVLAGFAVGTVFIRRQLGATRPIMPIDLLGRPVFALSTLGAFHRLRGDHDQHAVAALPAPAQLRLLGRGGGAALAPSPLTMMIVAPAAGALSDRHPAGLLGGIGMTLACTGLVALAFLPADARYLDVAWRMSLTGAGFGLFLSPNARLIIAPPRRIGRRPPAA